MADIERTRTVDVSADVLFDFLADISNLPRYFSRMTDAEPAGPGRVRVVADVRGQEAEGEADFDVDPGTRRIQWASPGPNDYHGWLQVTGDGNGGSQVSVHLTTVRVQDGEELAGGLEQTLETIARLAAEGTPQRETGG